MAKFFSITFYSIYFTLEKRLNKIIEIIEIMSHENYYK